MKLEEIKMRNGLVGEASIIGSFTLPNNLFGKTSVFELLFYATGKIHEKPLVGV